MTIKVLWVVNVIFPEVCSKLGISSTVTGGWLFCHGENVSNHNDIELGVVTVYAGNEFKKYHIGNINHFLIPKAGGARSKIRQDCWRKVINEFSPDLIHIHGTELGYGMELMNVGPEMKYVISMQGIVSVYYRYYMAGLSFFDVLRNITIRDILRWNTVFHARHAFYVQGFVEREYIKRAFATIGRTDWDLTHVKAINPASNYFFCNETLRRSFYENDQWSYDGCQKYSIFLSQGGYPIKGVHQVLRAVSILKGWFPDVHVYIAGTDVTNTSSLSARVRMGGYGKYLLGLIRKLGVESSITFLGSQSEENMKRQYLRSHVFICPSSIENSPNSLGEAQILGVPSIAAFSGGIPFMVQKNDSALLYRFEEHEMLAHYVRQVFSDINLAEKLSEAGRQSAMARHDQKFNLNVLVSIYKKLLSAGNGGPENL